MFVGLVKERMNGIRKILMELGYLKEKVCNMNVEGSDQGSSGFGGELEGQLYVAAHDSGYCKQDVELWWLEHMPRQLQTTGNLARSHRFWCSLAAENCWDL